jgi:hypothetical protein
MDEAAAVAWLGRRGGPADRELADMFGLFHIRLGLRHTGGEDLLAVLAVVAIDWWPHRRALRRARTSGRNIGTEVADSYALLNWHLVYVPLLAVLAQLSGALALCWIFGSPALQALFVILAVILVASGHNIPGFLAAAVAGAVAVSLWWVAAAAFVLTSSVAMYGRVKQPRAPVWARGPVFGFLPCSTVLRLLLRRQWSLFATGVDLATSEHADKATLFLDACVDLDTACQPVVETARAMVALHRGDLGEVVSHAGEALRLAEQAPDSVRGWCAMHRAHILQTTGRDEEAKSVREEALGLLRGRRCRRYRWRIKVEQIRHDLAHPDGSLPDLVDRTHGMRRTATRRHDSDLLDQTELWLATLMLHVGNDEGAAWTLRRIVGGEDVRGALHSTLDQTADELLLRASVDCSGNSAARHDARRDATAALHLLDARRRPLAAAAARLVLARLDERDGDADSALAQSAHALAAVHDAKYLLSSSPWRGRWTWLQIDAYHTTLRVVAARGDSELVAEALELVRGEVLPGTGAKDADLLGALEAITVPAVVSDPTVREDAAAALGHVSVDSVMRPPTVRVGGLQRLPQAGTASDGQPVGLHTVDLERELLAMAGRCWYWSATTIADTYYWAVRSPKGQWWHGSTPIGAGSYAERAHSNLRNALPMPRPDETEQESPLVREARFPAEYKLLLPSAEAFLPPPLSHGLQAHEHDAPTTLVVSLSASLSHMPIAALPLRSDRDVRVIDHAAVIHVPSWAMAVQSRRSRSPGGRRGHWPIRLALVMPSDDTQSPSWKPLAAAEPPPSTLVACYGPLTKADIRSRLTRIADRRDWVLHVVGHVENHPLNAAHHGLKVAGPDGPELLTLTDLVGRQNGGIEYPMPERVVLVGCGSIGVDRKPAFPQPVQAPHHQRHLRSQGYTPFSEWLGLAAGIMQAGANHVYCTLYPVRGNDQMRGIAHTIAKEMTHTTNPAFALRKIQLEQLGRWRSNPSGHPFLWQSVAYVGLGGEL